MVVEIVMQVEEQEILLLLQHLWVVHKEKTEEQVQVLMVLVVEVEVALVVLLVKIVQVVQLRVTAEMVIFSSRICR